MFLVLSLCCSSLSALSRDSVGHRHSGAQLAEQRRPLQVAADGGSHVVGAARRQARRSQCAVWQLEWHGTAAADRSRARQRHLGTRSGVRSVMAPQTSSSDELLTSSALRAQTQLTSGGGPQRTGLKQGRLTTACTVRPAAHLTEKTATLLGGTSNGALMRDPTG